MKILFLICPAHGHVNPTLPVAHELVARGEEVVYYLTDEFKERVERTGSLFRRIDNTFDTSNEIAKIQEGLQGRAASFKDILSFFAQYMIDTLPRVPELLERVRMEDADCIVYDPMCLWGYTLAKILDIPAATFYVTLAMTKDSSFVRQMDVLPPLKVMPIMLKLLWTSWKLHLRHGLPLLNPTDMLTVAEDLNIVSVPQQFQTDSNSFDDRYTFIGPSVLPSVVDYDVEFPFERLDGRPILYISLGTNFCNRPDFFKTCIEAFANTGWLVVMATWKKFELGNLPSNFIVCPRVPQLEVLQHTNVFINHGGMGSVMGALWYGVPMVVVPQMEEEILVADRVAELDLGIKLNTSPNTKALRDAVEAVATDSTYRASINKMQSSIQKAGGYRRAADEIQSLVYHIVEIPGNSKNSDPLLKLT